MYISIINGPNLNLLGRREPGVYGPEPFEACLARLRKARPDLELRHFQSNSEGALIDRLQADGTDPLCLGIALNAGAYTHTSLALADAVRAIDAPVVEVHISNVWKREPVRHVSLLSPACRGVVAGFGLDSYRLAVEALLADKA